jgi:hypothetical protein
MTLRHPLSTSAWRRVRSRTASRVTSNSTSTQIPHQRKGFSGDMVHRSYRPLTLYSWSPARADLRLFRDSADPLGVQVFLLGEVVR